ncbi:MAG: hypothetical protein B7Y39_18980 [Bdellovibrio sp. 28-41-41]|nr:MAG: hypothetical protein B7Y39_18980 [Bdellovibrio sp. 28-41-41]
MKFRKISTEEKSSLNMSKNTALLEKIRNEFRNWYGNLSVKELVYNRALIAEIEKLERLLAGKAVIG